MAELDAAVVVCVGPVPLKLNTHVDRLGAGRQSGPCWGGHQLPTYYRVVISGRSTPSSVCLLGHFVTQVA
jgi:hypothetical protein